jgi:Fur family transcriptional regulator, peroxide stress response regulator
MLKKTHIAIYRYSRQRERLLHILRKTTAHPTADWLYQRLKKEFPRLSLGTVYRNLSILMEQGLVKKLYYGSTFDRFEANPMPHSHLICEQCGQIADVDLPRIPDLTRQTAGLADFSAAYYKIDFFGLCAKCKKK